MLFIISSETFLLTSKIQQEKVAEEFCKKASKLFYITYFIILMFIGINAFLIKLMDEYWNKYFFTLKLIGFLVLVMHPLWTIKFLTFSVSDKDLSPELREKMKKLIRKRESIKKLRKYFSIPIPILLIICIVSFMCLTYFLGCFLDTFFTPERFLDQFINTIINAGPNLYDALAFLQVLQLIRILIFFMGFLSVVMFLICIIWQIPYLLSSIWIVWDLSIVKWFDSKPKIVKLHFFEN